MQLGGLSTRAEHASHARWASQVFLRGTLPRSFPQWDRTPRVLVTGNRLHPSLALPHTFSCKS